MGLQALAWTLTDEKRAERFLALTGLDAETLRSQVGDPTLLAALLKFLEAHEPDLLACAEGLGRDPADLVAARRALEA
ncbi:MAG: DUF3572 domain-containing protein [Parasphingopyxis sp.]